MVRMRPTTRTCLARLKVDPHRVVFLAKEMCVFPTDYAGTTMDHTLSEAPVPIRAGNRPRVQCGVLPVSMDIEAAARSNLMITVRQPRLIPVYDKLWRNEVLLCRHVELLLQT